MVVRYCSGPLSECNIVLPSFQAEQFFGRAVRPSDFSYKHRAERTVNLALTTLSDRMDEGIHDELRVALDASSAGATFLPLPLAYESLMQILGKLPIALLFPTFLYLHNTERLKKALQQILETLRLDVDKEPTVPGVSHSSDPFQRHFETLLYRDQELDRLRTKLCVADFCWVSSECFKERVSSLSFASRNG